jgi:hypothetical protein
LPGSKGANNTAKPATSFLSSHSAEHATSSTRTAARLHVVTTLQTSVLWQPKLGATPAPSPCLPAMLPGGQLLRCSPHARLAGGAAQPALTPFCSSMQQRARAMAITRCRALKTPGQPRSRLRVNHVSPHESPERWLRRLVKRHISPHARGSKCTVTQAGGATSFVGGNCGRVAAGRKLAGSPRRLRAAHRGDYAMLSTWMANLMPLRSEPFLWTFMNSGRARMSRPAGSSAMRVCPMASTQLQTWGREEVPAWGRTVKGSSSVRDSSSAGPGSRCPVIDGRNNRRDSSGRRRQLQPARRW